MKKVLLLLGLFLGIAASMQAQYPLVTIQDIQMVSAQDLSNCIDSSSYNGDTVRVRGRVQTHPDSARFSTGTRAQFWLQSGTSPWSGIDVIQFDDPQTNGVANLLPGDSVEITGVIEEYFHETEIVPLTGVNVQILGSGSPYPPVQVNIADLNDNQQANQVTSGEQWEGMYIEVVNASVATVDPFSGGTRVSFILQDGSGNKVNVSDKGKVQCLPSGNPPGNFVAPNVGDQYCHVRGVLTHSANGCTGSSGRGYEMHPFSTSDYCVNNAAPSLSNLTRNQVTPTSSQTVTICVDVTATNGVNSVTLNYATGAGSTNYTQVTMTNTGGSTYCADIPAQTDGTFVKYYASASDSSGLNSSLPDVPGGSDPAFYTVRDNGTTIFDVQYVPSTFSSGSSGYVDMQVTVEGVVTSSAEPGNMGFVFIQQENELAWAGIQLTDNAALATLSVGDKVSVTGVVKENFGFTRLEQVSSIQNTGTGTITALDLDPSTFTSYDFATNEAYESMLVRLVNSGGGQIYTVDANADAPSNFAELRIGSDQFDPNTGCRYIAGRVTSSASSSLDVSYVNDSSWASNSGTMNVPVCVAQVGDAFDAITGIMQYTFSNFKVTPRNNADLDNGPACIPTSRYEELEAGEIVAFPNPASQQLNIRYDLNGVSNLNAGLFDIMGRQVATGSLAGSFGTETIDLSSLQAGTYLLSVRNAAGQPVYNTRIVVVK